MMFVNIWQEGLFFLLSPTSKNISIETVETNATKKDIFFNDITVILQRLKVFRFLMAQKSRFCLSYLDPLI